MQSKVTGCHGQCIESTVGLVALGDNGESPYEDVSIIGFGDSALVNPTESAGGHGRAIGIEPLPGDRIYWLDKEAD